MAEREEELLLLSPQGGLAQGAVQGLLRFARRKPLGAAGVLVILLLIITAAFAPLIAPYDPLKPDLLDRLKGPSLEHPFGTDQTGRDLFSRVVYGSRVSLQVGFAVVIVSTVGGSIIGIVSGYFEGKLDLIVQRIMDSLQAIPGLLLAIAIAATLGPGTYKAILPIAIVILPSIARVVRSSTLSTKRFPYVEAARTVGASDIRIILLHILPNVTAPILILASILIGAAIIIEASLSFLGLGTLPPNPSWGNMLSGSGRTHMEVAPWIAIFPGLAITIVVLAFNFVGDALRDVWDPKLRGR